MNSPKKKGKKKKKSSRSNKRNTGQTEANSAETTKTHPTTREEFKMEVIRILRDQAPGEKVPRSRFNSLRPWLQNLPSDWSQSDDERGLDDALDALVADGFVKKEEPPDGIPLYKWGWNS